MRPDNQNAACGVSLAEFINTPAAAELLASADAAFGRIDFGNAADFLQRRLVAMPGLGNAPDLALGDLLEQIAALKDTAARLNDFAVEFYRQSGGLRLAVEAIKTFARKPTAANRALLLEAAAPLDGFHVRMPPRIRQPLRPFIKGYFWRREMLSYGKLYLAVHDHMRDGVIVG